VASLLDCTVEEALGRVNQSGGRALQPYYDFDELAVRWCCCRATVYNRLRQVGAKVLDFAETGKKAKKVVPARIVLEIEDRHTKRLH